MERKFDGCRPTKLLERAAAPPLSSYSVAGQGHRQ